MRVPALRLVYFWDFVKKSPFIRFKSVSALAQLSTYNSDSGSEEQSSSYSMFSQQYDTNTAGDQFAELDTFRVTEIMHKLRSEPSNAYSFFCQLKESGFKHDVDTCMAIIRILCHWGMHMKLDSILREVIESEKLHLGFDISDLFELLMEEALKPGGPYSLTRAFDALLKVYISLGMFEEAIDTFIHILFQTRRHSFVDIRTANYLMNQLVECKNIEKIDMAVAIYKQLKRHGLTPNVYTYGIVIKALCIKGNLEEAAEVLFKEMEKVGETPSAWTYTIFIDGLCYNGRSDLAYEILQDRRSDENVAFDVYAYMVVIQGFVKENKLREAELVLNEIEELGLFPNQDCYRALIRGYCEIGDIKKSFALHDEMQSKGIKTNCVIMSSILQCLCELGKDLEAVEQFNYFKSTGIFIDEVSFIIVMGALCKLGKVEEAMGFIIKKMDPNVRIYTTLINGYFINKKPRDAGILFEEMKKKGKIPDDITYGVLAYWFSKNGNERLVFYLLNDMKEQNLEPTPTTHKMIIKGLVDGCYESNDTYKAYKLFVEFLKQGIVVSRTCYRKLITAFCNANDMERARWVFDTMPWRGFIPDVYTYTIMLKGYCRKNWLREARDLFKDMKKKGIEPDVITYTVLIDGDSKMKRLRSRGRNDEVTIKTKYDDYAMSLWNEMKEMGLKPDVKCYTALIDRHCKSDSIDEAISIFNEMIDEDVEPDTAAYTTLISWYCSKGCIDRVETLIDEMSNKGIDTDARIKSVLEHGIVKAKKLQFRR